MSDTYTDSAADEVRRRFYAGQPPDPPPGQETSPTDPNASAPVDPHKRQLSPQSTANLPPPPPPPELPPPPHLYDMPRPDQYGMAPGQHQENPFAVFKNPMIWLGILGSLATRTPMLAAMGFATGAMEGYHKGNVEQFEENKTKFNEAITAAQDQNRKELAQYQVSLDQLKQKNWSEIMPGLWAQAAANNDQNAMSVIKLGPEAWEKFVIQRASAQTHLENAVSVERAKEEEKEAEIDRLKKDPGIIAQANAIRNYDQPMPSLSRSNPRNQAINELVTEQSEAGGAPYQTAGYGAKSKFVTGLGSTTTGSPGGQVNSAKIVVRHLDTLDKLIDDLGSGNTARFRRAAQGLQTEFGLSSAPTNFDAAVSLVSGEIVKLVEGAGGTGEDRAHVRSAFDRANSGSLLHDAVDVAREVMSARVDTLAEQAKASHAEDIFKRYLPPDIQDLLKPRRGKGGQFDVEDFKKKARAAGHSEAEIEQFLKDKGH